MAETLFETRKGPPAAAHMDWLLADVDDLLVHAGWRARLSFLACVVLSTLVAPLLIFRLPPFWALSPEDRLRALERLESTWLGLAVLGAKTVLCVIYYEHPEVAASHRLTSERAATRGGT